MVWIKDLTAKVLLLVRICEHFLDLEMHSQDLVPLLITLPVVQEHELEGQPQTSAQSWYVSP